MRRLVLCALLAAGCRDSPNVEHATLDGLEYAVPAGWQMKDVSERYSKIVVWSPRDNDGKQSVTLVRTEALPAVTEAGVTHLERVLDEAQRGLPRGRFGRPIQFRTDQGFAGVRIDGEFVPTGTSLAYRRVHAVVIDGTSLVHVIYTASRANRASFDLVLASLSRKDG